MGALPREIKTDPVVVVLAVENFLVDRVSRRFWSCGFHPTTLSAQPHNSGSFPTHNTSAEGPSLVSFYFIFFFSLFLPRDLFRSICMALFRYGSGGDTTMCEHASVTVGGGGSSDVFD